MVLVAYRCGLRASELVDFRWDQMDFTTVRNEPRVKFRRVRNGSAHPLACGSRRLPGRLGCRFGPSGGDEVCVRIARRFSDVLAAREEPTIVTVDIPIGLPDYIGPEGRGPERLIRPLLGARQSSVFSVPPRAAIYAADFGSACAAAVEGSTPPRKVSKQLFMPPPTLVHAKNQGYFRTRDSKDMALSRGSSIPQGCGKNGQKEDTRIKPRKRSH